MKLGDGVLDAWKNLQSNSKASKDSKLVWIIFKSDGKDKLVIDKSMALKDSDEEKDDCAARLKSFTDYLFNAKEPRFGGIDFKNKVCFVSYIDDNHPARSKFPYANSREGFKNALNGIQIDIQANSAGDLSYEEFHDEWKKKNNA